MREDRTVTPCIERPPDAPKSGCVDHDGGSKKAPTGVQAGPFDSVVCGFDNSVSSHTARDQAMLLASPWGTVELVPLPQLTDHGDRELRDACTGHDLIALGAGTSALEVLRRAPIPVLIARSLPLGTSVTDTILVPVDGSPGSTCALALAGRLAAAHGGTVAILADPPRDAAFQRAIAAGQRILLQATGTAPRLVGEQLPREEVVRSTAIALTASLVVLGMGHGETATRLALQIADRLGSSVLAVPA